MASSCAGATTVRRRTRSRRSRIASSGFRESSLLVNAAAPLAEPRSPRKRRTSKPRAWRTTRARGTPRRRFSTTTSSLRWGGRPITVNRRPRKQTGRLPSARNNTGTVRVPTTARWTARNRKPRPWRRSRRRARGGAAAIREASKRRRETARWKTRKSASGAGRTEAAGTTTWTVTSCYTTANTTAPMAGTTRCPASPGRERRTRTATATPPTLATTRPRRTTTGRCTSRASRIGTRKPSTTWCLRYQPRRRPNCCSWGNTTCSRRWALWCKGGCSGGEVLVTKTTPTARIRMISPPRSFAVP
mmetsp:Transcript_1266/g.4195  ORF Transcript_1266/g.4195 Transcript_1266/m.4195 type:complete len:303 (-) Transcript_1266:3515-4423(-)